MLKKSNRLTRNQFSDYFKSGKRFHSPTLTLIYTPHSQFHGSVVVGKKVAQLATRRTTVRRQLYEQLRQFAQTTQLTGVFILIVKPSYNALTRDSARAELTQLLQKIQN